MIGYFTDLCARTKNGTATPLAYTIVKAAKFARELDHHTAKMIRDTLKAVIIPTAVFVAAGYEAAEYGIRFLQSSSGLTGNGDATTNSVMALAAISVALASGCWVEQKIKKLPRQIREGVHEIIYDYTCMRNDVTAYGRRYRRLCASKPTRGANPPTFTYRP